MNINDTYNEKIKKIINDIKSATDIKSDIKPLPSEIKSKNNCNHPVRDTKHISNSNFTHIQPR
jgi:hypothetical protein